MGPTTLKDTRILVVEDEPLILMDTMDVLFTAGASVQGAYTVTEAECLLKREEFSAALIDWKLGRETALPVLALLASRGIPTLIYSGSEPAATLTQHVHFVSKPMSPLQLAEAVRGPHRRGCQYPTGKRSTTRVNSNWFLICYPVVTSDREVVDIRSLPYRRSWRQGAQGPLDLECGSAGAGSRSVVRRRAH